MRLHQNIHSHPFSRNDSLSLALASWLPRRSDRAAIRSAGWAFVRIAAGIDILNARLRNGTLAPQISGFMSNVKAAGRVHTGGQIRFRIAIPDREKESLRILPETILTIPGGSTLLSLFWLPALRTFWERTLRRHRFRQMQRLLPRAWFITDEDPPPGAVLPGLGIASKTRPLSHGRVCLIAGNSDDPAPWIVIEEDPLHPRTLVATYADQGSSVNLSSVELDPLPPSHG